jgi:hypothetical protein
MDRLKTMCATVKFTHVNINYQNIPIGRLIRIIQSLPNLDSIKICSLSPIEPGWLVGQDGGILFSTSINNKITKINLELITDIEQVNVIFYICRHIKYFQVNVPENMNLETFVRFIVKKASTYIPHLTSLCICLSNVNEQMISNLQELIGADKLLPNHKIKYFCNKILLKCNCS